MFVCISSIPKKVTKAGVSSSASIYIDDAVVSPCVLGQLLVNAEALWLLQQRYEPL